MDDWETIGYFLVFYETKRMTKKYSNLSRIFLYIDKDPNHYLRIPIDDKYAELDKTNQIK